MHIQALSVEQMDVLTAVHLAGDGCDTFPCITAGRALEQGLLEVREVDAAGSVNNLLVLNASPQFVFMTDGDILAGAKQNRVVNTSVLLFPHSKTVIPVSCVEAGRWTYVSPTFRGTDYVAPHSLRAEKAGQVSSSRRHGRGALSDQGAVWDYVALRMGEAQVDSASASLSDLYDKQRADFARLAGGFKGDAGANGLALFCGKRLLGLDLFNRKEIMQEYLPRLIRGAAAEAVGTGVRGTVSDAEARYRTLELCDEIEAAVKEEHPGVGAGTEHRFAAGKFTGFELRHNDCLIHLTALQTADRRKGRDATPPGIVL